MSDLFEELSKSIGSTDPTDRAKASMKRVLPKRFYKAVTIEAVDDALRILLDGKPVRTPARSILAVARPSVAEALAEEWRAQGEFIDPARMPLTRLVNSTLDGVAAEIDAVKGELLQFAGSDMLYYRADSPQRLVDWQNAAWQPVIAWAEQLLGARFRLAEGVVHVVQDESAIAAIGARLPDDPLELAAFHTVTTLSGSVLLALSLREGFRAADAVWQAAHVDEDWNAEQWGLDSEAVQRRAYRRAEFDAAVLALLA